MIAIATVMILCVTLHRFSPSVKAESIKEGMAQAEVEALLGPPTSEIVLLEDPEFGVMLTSAVWEYGDGYIAVNYCNWNRCVELHSSSFQPTLWHRFSQILGLSP